MPSVFTIEGARGGGRTRQQNRMKRAAKVCKGLKKGAFKSCMKRELQDGAAEKREKEMGKGLGKALGFSGGKMSPLVGAAVGGGLSFAGSQLAPRFTALNPTAVGFGLGAAASGAMLLFRGTRKAGFYGLVGAAAAQGVRFALQKAGVLSGVVIDRTQSLMGVEIERTQSLMGSQMPTLVGANLSAASDHVQLIGGPALSQVAGHFGATLVG